MFQPFNFLPTYGQNPGQDRAEDTARQLIDRTRDMSAGGLINRQMSDPAWRSVFDLMHVRDLGNRLQGGPGVRANFSGVGTGMSVKQGGQTVARSYGDGSTRDITQPAVQGLLRAVRR